MKNACYLFLLFMVLSCSAQEKTGGSVDPAAFEKGMAAPGVQVLDVRTAAEFRSGHIANALLADWTDKKEFTRRVGYMDKDRPVYVYCLVGSRSASAASWMRANGFKQVIELGGGINAWKRAGKMLEGQPSEKQLSMEEYLALIPADSTVLVDFGAKWCAPCLKMEPVLKELQSLKEPVFSLLKVDAGVHTRLMEAVQVEEIPVFIIYKNGKETWRKSGMVSKEELLEQLK